MQLLLNGCDEESLGWSDVILVHFEVDIISIFKRVARVLLDGWVMLQRFIRQYIELLGLLLMDSSLIEQTRTIP